MNVKSPMSKNRNSNFKKELVIIVLRKRYRVYPDYYFKVMLPQGKMPFRIE